MVGLAYLLAVTGRLTGRLMLVATSTEAEHKCPLALFTSKLKYATRTIKACTWIKGATNIEATTTRAKVM